MNRRRFIGLAAAGLFGLTRGRLPVQAATPAPTVALPEGTFLVLDGGILDLGVYRDSTLDVRNSFEIFAETFENVSYLGDSPVVITTASA